MQAGFQGHGGQFGERGLDARAAQEARELQKLQQLQQLGLTGAAGAGGQRQHEAQQVIGRWTDHGSDEGQLSSRCDGVATCGLVVGG